MGSGLAAKRRGSRGRRRARCAHLTREAVRRGPLAPSELRSRAQPARRRAPTCAPPRVPRCPPTSPPRTWASQAQKDTGRGALRPLPPLPPPEQDASLRAATLHNRSDRACPAAARGVTLHVAGARAAALPTASPSALAGEPRPPGCGVPARVSYLPPAGDFGGAMCGLRSEEGRERLGQTAHHGDILAFIHWTHC